MQLPVLLPGTRNVLIVVVVTFVATVLVAGGLSVPVAELLAISPTPSLGWSWQWATHWMASGDGGGAFRKLVELAVLYVMGSQYEALAGARRLYGLCVVAIVGAAVGTFATIWMTPVAPWGDMALTSAIVCALAVRASGRAVEVPILGATSPWLFVAAFGAVAALDAFYYHFAPIAGSYAGACLAAFAYERVAIAWPSRKRAAPASSDRRVTARRGAPHLRVIEGDRSDDEKPKYLN